MQVPKKGKCKRQSHSGVAVVPSGHIAYSIDRYRDGRGNVWIEGETVTVVTRERRFYEMVQLETVTITVTFTSQRIGDAYECEQIVTTEVEVTSASPYYAQMHEAEATRTVCISDRGSGNRPLLEDSLSVS